MLGKYDLTKKFLLSLVTEQEIFEYYFGGAISLKKHYKNPLRTDTNEGCSFFIRNSDGRLIFRDWSYGELYDCFDFVQHAFKVSFARSLSIIYKDLVENKGSGNKIDPDKILKREDKKRLKLRIKRRDYRAGELAFWTINQKLDFKQDYIEKNKIYCLESLWENDLLKDRLKMTFAYHFTGYDYQIYFPTVVKTHTTRRFINPHGIKYGDMEFVDHNLSYLIITKSKKDAFYLRLFGFNAFFIINEAILLDDTFFDSIGHFSHIFTLFDDDRAGKHASWLYRTKHSTIPVFVPNGKDFAGFLNYNGQMTIQQEVNKALYYLQNL